MNEKFDPDVFLKKYDETHQQMMPVNECLMKKDNVTQFSFGFGAALLLCAFILGAKRFWRHS
jgi:hypothetical protein